MIHLADFVLYSVGAFIGFTTAQVLYSYSDHSKTDSDLPIISKEDEKLVLNHIEEHNRILNDKFLLKPGQIAIPGHWKETAEELIQIAKEMQKPRTIAVINDKIQTQQTRRISKRGNKASKKRTAPKRSRNRSIKKASGLRAK